MPRIPINISRAQGGLVAALLFQVLVLVARLSVLFPEIVRPFLVLVALIVIPGTLTALLLYNRLPIWQIVGLGLAFGLGEALILGRILLLVGAATDWLGYAMLVPTVILTVWLWRHLPADTTSIHIDDWRPWIIPLGLLLAIWVMLIQVNLTYPTYPVDTVQLNDKWTYLTVIQQFLVSPGHLNLHPDTVIAGTNTRLSWNAWLYFTAALSQLTGIHPVQLIFHDLRPTLFLFPVCSLFLLGYELFQKAWVALSGAALQFLLLIGVDFYGYWLWMRLEEDKYFAFVVVMPLAWVFLLRVLKDRRYQNVIGLLITSISLALIHPLGIPGLLLTGVPVAVVEWWLNRKKGFRFSQLLLVLAAMTGPIVITVIDEILVLATPYVRNYIATAGSLPGYTLSTVTQRLPPNATFLLVLLIPLGMFALKDRVARFCFLVMAACATVLCVPIVTVIVSRISTSVGIDRYAWLIPFGFIAIWLILKIAEWLRRSSSWQVPAALTAGTIVAVLVLSGWHQWTVDHAFWLFRLDVAQPRVVLSQGQWQAFLDTAADVQGQRVVAPVEDGLIVPTVWPDANPLIFNSPIHAPTDWPTIQALYQSQDVATAWTYLDRLQPQAVFVPHTSPLYNVLSQAQFKSLYNGDEAALFGTDIAPTRQMDDVTTLIADQYTLKPGDCAQVAWAAPGLQHLEFDSHTVEATGTEKVCPDHDSVYTLRGQRSDGSPVEQNIHVFVAPTYDYLTSFDADRYVIQPGECAILRWHVEQIDGVYFQNNATVGQSSMQECPTTDSVYSLRVKLRNQETITRSIIIYVRKQQ